MKKITLYTILVITLVMLAGCKKKDIVLKTDNVKANTVVIKKDGTVQAASVEEFTKDYYNLAELEEYINNQVNVYNTASGEEAITVKSLELNKNNAILILDYKNIDSYASFNKVIAINQPVTEVAAKSADLGLPNVYTSKEDGSYVNADIALKNQKYKVYITNENIDIQFEGDVKFYSNAALAEDSKVQTGTEGNAIIVYKPW
jgi:hypothetical protein